jgi:hypothetical protein
MVATGALVPPGKQFFFEKKHQKTLTLLVTLRAPQT